ncbi:hypothetical protein [Spirosoma fluviale]|uniref:Uncharacterized protein n=1 Tax=Spirosoma fluviale TaxID=1597977 RepID=A0A286F8K3_9BACT|nr:hypothetical protein [Spirosoma fluviale]SOD79557.1 hypothetical protein SAMN06269250_0999 [Spirosoma fluviale]
MKTYLIIFAFSSFLISTASAQDDRKLRNDPTYSTHNYKHPNKAKTAEFWKSESGIVVRAPGFSQGPIANYKQPVPGNVPAGGVTLPHTPEMDVAVRNYKAQQTNVIRSTTQSASVAVERLPVQPVSGGNQ